VKVAIVCAAGIVSGKEIMCLELAEGLRERGAAVEVVSSRWSDGAFSARLGEKGLASRRMRLGFISATLDLRNQWMTAVQAAYWPQLIRSYRAFLRDASPVRVVHTNWHHLLLLWPFLDPKRDLFWLHEVVPGTPRYRRAFQVLAGRLGLFVAVSRAVARSLTAIGIPPRQIQVVHNGISDVGLSSASKREPSQRLGIVGRVGDWKGHEDLIAAFAKIAPVLETAELHIFGEGAPEYEVLLKSQVAQHGLDARVRWHGFSRERAAIYREIDVCVVPSRSEDPLPTVAIEAAFSGIPVIAARRGGLEEIVEDGQTGLCFESGNRAALEARILELLPDAVRQKALGLRAREMALERFGRTRFLDEFVAILEGGPSLA
jgi:glycosyltransferase involved in cell wall biosynthesis